jgi:hypothetical protein
LIVFTKEEVVTMDSRFLELWGQVLIQAARNQELLEKFAPGSSGARDSSWDFSTWAEQWFEQLPAFQSLFLQNARLNELSESGLQSLQAWQQGLEAFHEQWQEFARLLGLVPRQDYDRLSQENEQLKEQVQEQQATIERLNSMLSDRNLFDPDQMSEEFDRLLKRHNKQFEEFMQSFEQTWKTDPDSGGGTQG